MSDFDFFNEINSWDFDTMIDSTLLPHQLDAEVFPYEDLVAESTLSVLSEYKLPVISTKEKLWSKELHPEITHSIKSFVGDDEVNTTNNLVYAAACIAVGPILARVKVSWTDVQFSRSMFNYAEGWILMPPTIDSSFESVNRYNRGNGVPFVLDSPKLKNLSAVRKQSDMNVDLASKFRNLAESAAWTDVDWFTYDIHQFALVLGTEIFDFVKSKQFPYLFKWEGGCGGAPPWNNLLTAAGSLFRYRRGRAQRGVLGIMEDSQALLTASRKPQDCWFARNLNLAMCDDRKWAAVTSELERRRAEADSHGAQYVPLETEVADNQLPPELVAKATVIEPEDALTGIAVSHLREKGYLMTEADLVSKNNSHERIMAVWGDRPLKEIEDQISLRKEEYREAYLERLDVLSRQESSLWRVYSKVFSIGHPMEYESLAVMAEYYKMRVEQNSIFSSFLYNDRIRVFKARDVHEFYTRDMKSVRDSFARDVGSRWLPDSARALQLPHERDLHTRISRWMDSGGLTEIIRHGFPPGVGPDDARLVRDMKETLATDRGSKADGVLYLVITDDKKAVQSAQLLLDAEAQSLGIELRLVALSTNDFVRYSLLLPPTRPRRRYGFEWISVPIRNPYTEREAAPHGPLGDALEKEARHLYRCRQRSFRVFYDYPNINRKLRRFQPDATLGGVREFSGGFLRRSTAQTNALAGLETGQISALSDFSFMEKGYRGPMNTRTSLKLYSAKRGVEIQQSWR